MVLIWLALAGAGLFCLLTSRWRGALVFGIFLLALSIPDILRAIEFWRLGIDDRRIVEDGHIDIVAAGSIPFSTERRPGRYGRSLAAHRTVLASGGDERQIGFTIMALRSYDTWDFSGCPTRASSFGLLEITGRGTGYCPHAPTTGRTTYVADDNPGSANFHMECWASTAPANRGAEMCAMDLLHDGMHVSVSLWEYPRAGWAQVRDHVVALLDQSFRPVPDR